MNNILVQQLPTTVEIAGRECDVRTDFRDCLLVIMAFEDPGLTEQEKAAILLENLYPEPPEDPEEAARAGVQFLNGGAARETDEAGPGAGRRYYSFQQDAALIYSAFRQTHGIDLQDVEYLHWWKFLALFMDLGSETTFCQIVNLRRRIKTGRATKEEKRAYREMRALAELDETDTRSQAEIEQDDEFMRQVREAEERRRAEQQSNV